MKDAFILEVLQKATTAAVAASVFGALPVKYLGRIFDVPSDQTYLELVFIPNNRNNDFWGDKKNYAGMFRLILHWPNDNVGAYGPMNVINSICSYFPKDNLLSGVQLVEPPDFKGSLENGTETLYTASLQYQFFG